MTPKSSYRRGRLAPRFLGSKDGNLLVQIWLYAKKPTTIESLQNRFGQSAGKSVLGKNRTVLFFKAKRIPQRLHAECALLEKHSDIV